MCEGISIGGNVSIQISGSSIPPDGSVTAVKIGSGAAGDGQVLTADGAGGAAWETPDWRQYPRIVHTADVAAGAAMPSAWLTASFYAAAGRNPIPGDMLVYRYYVGDPPEIGGEASTIFIMLVNEWATATILGEL